jgi:hypothetical protein
MHLWSIRVSAADMRRLLLCVFLLAGPTAARAELHLLDAELSIHASNQVGGPLDFDLLAPPPPTAPADPALARRRTLLNWHQGAGIGLFALTVATVVVGQLNYNDRFAGRRPSTGNYIAPHALLATGTLVVFAGTGALALLAPAAPARRDRFDRISLHKLAMFTAAAGMAAEGALGIWTQQREGYLNQESVARAHLVLGYAVLAAITTGVGAIIF